MPCSVRSIAGALPSVAVTGGLQLHPRVPKALGSALAGVAMPAAALNAIAAPINIFLITNESPSESLIQCTRAVRIRHAAGRTPRC
jgi:hypothetical protein